MVLYKTVCVIIKSDLRLHIRHMIFTFSGCNFYGFGAIFFGCLDMLIHGTAALSRYLMVVKSQDGEEKINVYNKSKVQTLNLIVHLVLLGENRL